MSVISWNSRRRAAILLVAVLLASGCTNREPPKAITTRDSESATKAGHMEPAALEAATRKFCGDCHDFPPPESFPREAWKKEVEQGYGFYNELKRKELEVPPVDEVIAFYQNLAPESLTITTPAESAPLEKWLQFDKVYSDRPKIELPAVSFIKRIPTAKPADEFIAFCDMRSGEIRTWNYRDGLESKLRATLVNPAHIEPCDLDRDGATDYIVADLASLRSEDHHRGAVVWLRPHADKVDWEVVPLATKLGRVADAEPVDIDEDGDLDILAAEFGHFRTGGIWVLENVGMDGTTPKFERHKLDDRHGTIHLVPWKRPGDKHLGFMAVISQEYEVVDFFRQTEPLKFEKERVFTAGDPAYGSSGIQLVDLDADGDLDVLYSNGDTFGSLYIKPYHAIHWLENRGELPFVDHSLAGMIGVQRAVAADLDADGDLDIVAVAILPENLRKDSRLPEHDSILLLEQTKPGEFSRYSMEKGNFIHAAVEVADFDQDGDQDLCIGNLQGLVGEPQPRLTMWLNRKVAKKQESK